MKSLLKKGLPYLLIGAAAAGFFCTTASAGPAPAPPASPIVGNITFAGTVTLDTATVDTATTATGWAGPAPTSGPGTDPVVQSRDGSFAVTVSVGDYTTFQVPWTFNLNLNTTISNFWSVDNFTFDLTTSHIVFQQQGSGFLVVQGTGTVKGTGFLDTPGTWNFTTQDPSADGQFSFSAATAAVPEGSTGALFGIGALVLAVCARSKKSFFRFLISGFER